MQSSKTQPKNPADVISTPSAGTTGEHAGINDALGTSHKQNQSSFKAEVSSDEKLKATRMKQLGLNGYAAN